MKKLILGVLLAFSICADAATYVVPQMHDQSSTELGWVNYKEPMLYKSATIPANTASSSVWQPTTGYRWRMLAVMVEVSDNATLSIAGVDTLTLVDNGSNTPLVFDFYLPSTAVSGIGEGYLNYLPLGPIGIAAAAEGTGLDATLGTQLATGQVHVLVEGVEEP